MTCRMLAKEVKSKVKKKKMSSGFKVRCLNIVGLENQLFGYDVVGKILFLFSRHFVYIYLCRVSEKKKIIIIGTGVCTSPCTGQEVQVNSISSFKIQF